jgi:hypothetical protein
VHGKNFLKANPKEFKCVEESRVCPMFDLPPCVDRSAFGVTKKGLLSCCPWSPVVSWKVESCRGRAQMFWRVILDGEAKSGTHPHSGEAGFSRMWWIQGAIIVTLTVVGIDKTTTKGPL